MCTYNEDEELVMISKQSLPPCGKICRSCDNPAKVVLRKKDAYCKSCFLSSAVHKFRAALGKSRMLKAGDRVLVVFTGNSSSMSLLHFLQTGLNEEINKRLVFFVDLLFIDDGLVSNVSFKKRENIVEEAKSIAKSFNFNMLITTLSEALSVTPHAEIKLNVNECLEKEMGIILENVKSNTAKKDLLCQLRYRLIMKISDNLGYDKVFTPEIGNNLAVKLLAGISLGRGDQISAEVGFCDNRNSKIPILRPLKDFTQKEIIYYNIFEQVKPLTMISALKMSWDDLSIQTTTEKFVNDLEEKFPSTVYTIFRTGDKLKMNESRMSEEENVCMLCSKVSQKNSKQNYNAMDALDFSNKISQVENEDMSVCLNNCCCHNENRSQECEGVENFFCYGCNLIFKDMECKDTVKRYLAKKNAHVKNIENLENEISEFLID